MRFEEASQSSSRVHALQKRSREPAGSTFSTESWPYLEDFLWRGFPARKFQKTGSFGPLKRSKEAGELKRPVWAPGHNPASVCRRHMAWDWLLELRPVPRDPQL